jgi:hypothetical protein
MNDRTENIIKEHEIIFLLKSKQKLDGRHSSSGRTSKHEALSSSPVLPGKYTKIVYEISYNLSNCNIMSACELPLKMLNRIFTSKLY